ncbi:LPS export ABC transporter periplasmic protein LptC [Kriegella aquimaris]|nr:LPS export ABC transporter periplasmic protein LptC [Kriegella aquimaris]
MTLFSGNKLNCIAVLILMAMLFFSCQDNYKRVGDEAQKQMYPRGVAHNFRLVRTKAQKDLDSEDSASSKVIAILTSSVGENYENLSFPHMTFPEGLQVDFFDDENRKSIIRADYGIVYSISNVIDLQGNVIIESHDGKKLETSQLYYDQDNEWIFTQEKFKYTNPEDGTVMDGEGMDFYKDLSLLKAHKTNGLMMIKEEADD